MEQQAEKAHSVPETTDVVTPVSTQDENVVDQAAAPPETLHVEVAYARPDKQMIIPLEVPVGTTLEQAIELSGIREHFPEIDLSMNKVGIFGKLNKRDTVLREQDRVEIYRKLIADPKKVRKERAAQGKVMKKGGDTAVAAESSAAVKAAEKKADDPAQ